MSDEIIPESSLDCMLVAVNEDDWPSHRPPVGRLRIYFDVVTRLAYLRWTDAKRTLEYTIPEQQLNQRIIALKESGMLPKHIADAALFSLYEDKRVPVED